MEAKYRGQGDNEKKWGHPGTSGYWKIITTEGM